MNASAVALPRLLAQSRDPCADTSVAGAPADIAAFARHAAEAEFDAVRVAAFGFGAL